MSYFGDTAGTYISSSFHSNFETPAETQEDSLADDHHPDDGQYDFLSFLALISRKTAFTAWTSLATNSVHITPSNIRMSEKLRHGSYFSVSLATRKDFVKLLPAGVADYQIPQLVAVKTPILDKNLFSRKSRRIFDSMVREYQILNHEYLRKHQNIVSIIGCCWRTVDADTGLTVPNLVLEGAELGDLEHFYRRYDNEITVRKRLGLCIDVATGVEALYMAGIVHGDIKPRNILVFKNRDRGFIAKIADFGSSIFLHNTSFPRRACIGTREFAAPETVDSSEDFGMEDLCRSEIYSLGIVLLFIVKGSLVLDKLFSVNGDVLKQQKFRGDLRNWIQRDQEQPAADCMTRETFGKNAIERERQKVIWDWHDTQMTRMFSASQKREGYSRHQNLVDDEGWITLQNTNFRSQHGERLFNSLLDEMTAGKSSARPGNPSYVLQMLRKILRSELRIIYDSNQFDQSREEKRYMTLLQRFNPTALNAGSSISTLNSQEIEEIVLNYFVSEDRKASFLRELCFLWRHGRIAKYPAKHRSPITGRLKRRVIVPTSKKYVQ